MPVVLGYFAAGLVISDVNALTGLGERLGEIISDANTFENKGLSTPTE